MLKIFFVDSNYSVAVDADMKCWIGTDTDRSLPTSLESGQPGKHWLVLRANRQAIGIRENITHDTRNPHLKLET